MSPKTKSIILTGGGSGGPVTPLLALAGDLRGEGYDLRWIGTKNGIERPMVEEQHIAFDAIAAGKLRRYFSLKNLIDPFKIGVGFFQALTILNRIKPSLVMSAGGFVSVPVAWAAWVLRIPVLIHQQDIRPGLANKLMAPCAAAVTVTFEKSLGDYGNRACWTGNPVRPEFRQVREAAEGGARGQSGELPNLLVLSGGTGAEAINDLVARSVHGLSDFCSITQVSGKHATSVPQAEKHYTPVEFLNAVQMAKAMQTADLVVTRAGLGTLTELSYLGKATIVIPMPHSHQEDNAEYLKKHDAALVCHQMDMHTDSFIELVRDVLADTQLRADLGHHLRESIKAGNEALLKVIKDLTA